MLFWVREAVAGDWGDEALMMVLVRRAKTVERKGWEQRGVVV